MDLLERPPLAGDDSPALARALGALGLGEEAISRKQSGFEDARRALAELTSRPEAVWVLHVPGRVEWLGKHTDYAGGPTLTSAIEHGFHACFTPNELGTLRVVEAGGKRRATLSLESPGARESEGWETYLETVVRRLTLNFGRLERGLDLAYGSDLPEASGLSSSSALMVMTALALLRVNELARTSIFQENIPDLEHLALYLATIENGQSLGSLVGERGVGTAGGSEDHTAILLGEVDRLGLHRHAPSRHEGSIELPPDLSLAVATCGIPARKTAEARERFNDLSRLAREAAELQGELTGIPVPHLGTIRDPRERKNLVKHARKDLGHERLARRAEHFFVESDLIESRDWRLSRNGDDAVESLVVSRFGLAADLSHETGAALLGNQIPETVLLARLARIHGARAASAQGAGFGGAVWALVEREGAREFLETWREAYRERFPDLADRMELILTRPGPPAGFLEA